MEEKKEDLLISNEVYMESGIHIGTRIKSSGMSRFIFKTREDGLYLLDINTIDKRIRYASNLLSQFDPKDVLVTASRIYAIAPAKKFAEIAGFNIITGRIVPGFMTNPMRSDFIEPKIILVSDTRNEKEAVKEAEKTHVAVIALSDTDNIIRSVDLVIPCNNKGRKSLALVYYLLAREYLKARGAIKVNEEFKYQISDFEAKVEATAQE